MKMYQELASTQKRAWIWNSFSPCPHHLQYFLNDSIFSLCKFSYFRKIFEEELGLKRVKQIARWFSETRIHIFWTFSMEVLWAPRSNAPILCDELALSSTAGRLSGHQLSTILGRVGKVIIEVISCVRWFGTGMPVEKDQMSNTENRLAVGRPPEAESRKW